MEWWIHTGLLDGKQLAIHKGLTVHSLNSFNSRLMVFVVDESIKVLHGDLSDRSEFTKCLFYIRLASSSFESANIDLGKSIRVHVSSISMRVPVSAIIFSRSVASTLVVGSWTTVTSFRSGRASSLIIVRTILSQLRVATMTRWSTLIAGCSMRDVIGSLFPFSTISWVSTIMSVTIFILTETIKGISGWLTIFMLHGSRLVAISFSFHLI